MPLVGQPGVNGMGITLSRAWNALGALGSSLEALGWDVMDSVFTEPWNGSGWEGP